MSYEIVKSVGIKDGGVWVTSAANNLRPLLFSKWECGTLTDVLKTQGRKAAEKEILYSFWSGDFQRCGNIYDRSVKYFNIAHPDIGWMVVGGKVGETKFGETVTHTDGQLKQMLHETYIAFKARDLSTHYALKLSDGSYLCSRSKRYLYSTENKDRAKVFTSREDAVIEQSTIADNFGEKGISLAAIKRGLK
jgi:hypothetical protein